MTKRRIWLPGQHYHVINRGIRKDKLFYKQADYEFFMELLANASKKYSFSITSYCLLNNHYHLQFCSHNHNLSVIMNYINMLYARYFNSKYKFHGPVFQGRYKAFPVKDRRGMLHLARYIHYNPIEAKLVSKPEQYRWSSMQYYMPDSQLILPDYLNLSPILDLFYGNNIEKKKKFVEWSSYN